MKFVTTARKKKSAVKGGVGIRGAQGNPNNKLRLGRLVLANLVWMVLEGGSRARMKEAG